MSMEKRKEILDLLAEAQMKLGAAAAKFQALGFSGYATCTLREVREIGEIIAPFQEYHNHLMNYPNDGRAKR